MKIYCLVSTDREPLYHTTKNMQEKIQIEPLRRTESPCIVLLSYLLSWISLWILSGILVEFLVKVFAVITFQTIPGRLIVFRSVSSGDGFH